MGDDFCMFHGYGHMVPWPNLGSPLTTCAKCDEEKAMTDKYDAKARELIEAIKPFSSNPEKRDKYRSLISSALRSAAAEEREECARLMDRKSLEFDQKHTGWPSDDIDNATRARAFDLAADSIRSLKSNPKGEDHDAG